MKPISEIKVLVAISGGVDSAVSAYLLKERGYQVSGLFMHNWEDDRGFCTSKQDRIDAELVCKTLQIPFHTVSFVKEYWNNVFSTFLKDIEAGLIPSPDILCNKEIKFKALLKHAMALGADYLATGHYVKLHEMEENGKRTTQLLRAKDSNKDQTYFLAGVPSDSLSKVIFPLGDLLKSEVREIARKAHLHVSDKRDSVGICFIGKRNFQKFIGEYLPPRPGKFICLETGLELGDHLGAHLYTIGQRARLSGFPSRMLVCFKDMQRNLVFVCPSSHPALWSRTLLGTGAFWVSGAPPRFPLDCQATTRSTMRPEPCRVSLTEDQETLSVTFQEPQWGLTEGQVVTFYQDQVCLGNATIHRTPEAIRMG